MSGPGVRQDDIMEIPDIRALRSEVGATSDMVRRGLRRRVIATTGHSVCLRYTSADSQIALLQHRIRRVAASRTARYLVGTRLSRDGQPLLCFCRLDRPVTARVMFRAIRRTGINLAAALAGIIQAGLVRNKLTEGE